MKRILMIAYHFPPLAGSSGIQRTLRFVQHLPSLGWQPLVLTADPRAYDRTSCDLLNDVPAGTVVRRAFALDTARHLQCAGRYLGWMARPDRWVSWRFAAVRQSLKMIEEFKVDVIWSTYPIATAHMVASTLHRKTGIPWVADFRDPMAHDGYPADPLTWQSFQRIEADAVATANYCVFTTPGAASLYQQRYPDAAGRMVVIENGYDEECFSSAALQAQSWRTPEFAQAPILMLHSGIVYPLERDPSQFFMALGQLNKEGAIGSDELRIRFRASVHDDLLTNLAKTHGVQEFIELCPAVPYQEALTEMLDADVLLLMQGSNCNAQIPAKLYEYLRAGKPVLGLTDPAGDTAAALRKAGLTDIMRLDSADDIALKLPAFVRNCRQGKLALPNPLAVKQASRYLRSKALAALLQQVS